LIKIRYTHLPAGLHVRAEASGRNTTIYLLPGLSHGERRSALLRARRSAALGYGPRLPAAGVAAAVTRDRIAATVRNGLTAFAGHPLLLLPPLLTAATATLMYVMLSAVAVTFPPGVRDAPGPQGRPGASRPGSIAAGTAAAGRSSLPAGGTARQGPGRPRAPRSPDPAVAPAPGTASPGPARPPAPGPGSPPGSLPPLPSSPVSLLPSPAPGSTCVPVSVLGICLK
jgi:hypothetical protein